MNKFKITEKLVNYLLIFILGFLVGVAVKSEAQKRVTIGFNDYLVSRYKQDIDLMTPKIQNQNMNQAPAGPGSEAAPETNNQ